MGKITSWAIFCLYVAMLWGLLAVAYATLSGVVPSADLWMFFYGAIAIGLAGSVWLYRRTKRATGGAVAVKKEGKSSPWEVYWFCAAANLAALALTYAVLSETDAPTGRWMTFAAIAAITFAGFVWLYRLIKRTGEWSNPFRWKCGGIYLVLARRNLPSLKGLSKRKRQEKFAAMYEVAMCKSPVLKGAEVLSFVLVVVLWGYPEIIGGEFLREWAEGNRTMWNAGVFALKVFVYDAISGWVLYRLMRKEEVLI